MTPQLNPFSWRVKEFYRDTLEKSSLIREFIYKYRKWFVYGLTSLIIVDVLELVPPLILKEAVDISIGAKGTDTSNRLFQLALVYFLVSLVQSLGRYGWRVFLIRASIYSGRDLRERFGKFLFSSSASFFDKHRLGELMSLATNDAEAVRMAIGSGILTLADALFYFILVPIVMFQLSPKIALITLIPIPLIPLFVIKMEKLIHERFKKVQEGFSDISASASETLAGLKVVKGMAKEDFRLGQLSEIGLRYRELALRLSRVQGFFSPSLDFMMSLGLVLLVAVGGDMVTDHAISIGTFVAFQRYVQKMVWPMMAIGMAITIYQRAVASSDRIKTVMATYPDVKDKLGVENRFFEKFPEAVNENWRTQGKIEFRNLNFSFPNQNSGSGATLGAAQPKQILKDISLVINPGDRVAILGAVGSGKSTLLSLLPRLYPVTDGQIFIDDVDINDWPLEILRAQVGYVAQEVFLFSTSVEENVNLGLQASIELAPRRQATETAVKLAAIHDEISGLEQGFDTRVGERGVLLSGGQRQRVTIARALAKRPSILAIDDALSAVDVETEEKILAGLRARSSRNTELIAAHRLSTVRDADRVVVLELGRIRQLGTHAELWSDRRGLYRKYLENQQAKEALEAIMAKPVVELQQPGGL